MAGLKAGERIVLAANPDYWEGRPYLSRVVYRVIPSQATTFLELKAKGVDSAALTALQYTRQTDYPAFKAAYTKFRYPSNAYTYFGFNLKDPRFADRRVRQAVRDGKPFLLAYPRHRIARRFEEWAERVSVRARLP